MPSPALATHSPDSAGQYYCKYIKVKVRIHRYQEQFLAIC